MNFFTTYEVKRRNPVTRLPCVASCVTSTHAQDDNRQMVNDHNRIMWYYLNSWFMVDLISSIPAEYIVPDSGNSGILFRAVKMFKLVKLMRVLRLGRLVNKAQEAFGVKNGTVMIIKFAGVLLLSLIHI